MSDKQDLFVNYYLQCFNGTRSYKLAYGVDNDNVAAVEAHRLLRNPKIREVIEDRLAEEVMSANEALARLSDMARGVTSDYLTSKGKLDIAKLIDDGKGHLVKKIREGKYGMSYEFYDAQRANELIARHYGAFTDRLEVDRELTINVRYGNDDTD